MSKIWEDIITPEEIQIYKETGFTGQKVGLGNNPALLIIDVQYRTLGTNVPILQSIKESGYNSSCGEMAWSSVAQIKELLAVIRKKSIPVIYAIVERSSSFDAGRWADKIPGFGTQMIHREGNRGTVIVEEIKPKDNDIIISKRYPSAFFGTHLMTHLNILRTDSLIITGCTTSGCVRATVIDAFSYGFKVIIPQECVYDRSITSHKVNLFDMNYKYADVLTLNEVIDELEKKVK